jgi:hypothetical protein
MLDGEQIAWNPLKLHLTPNLQVATLAGRTSGFLIEMQ